MIGDILGDGVMILIEVLSGLEEGREEPVIEAQVDRPSPEELEAWARKGEALAAQIPPEDFGRVEEALAEADRQAKPAARPRQ